MCVPTQIFSVNRPLRSAKRGVIPGIPAVFRRAPVVMLLCVLLVFEGCWQVALDSLACLEHKTTVCVCETSSHTQQLEATLRGILARCFCAYRELREMVRELHARPKEE